MRDILGDHHQITNRYAIATRRGHHAQLQGVEDLAAFERHLIRQAHGLQPLSPVAAIRGGMQQFGGLQARQIPGLLAQGFWRADRNQPFGKQLGAFPFLREIALTEQYGAVERLMQKVHLIHVHPGAGQLHLTGA